MLQLLGGILTPQAGAQQRIDWHHTVYQDDFAAKPSGPIYIADDASWYPPEQNFQLTPAATGKAGRLFVSIPYHMRNFVIRFDAWFGGKESNEGGADGIVAVFGQNYLYPPSFGGNLNFTGSEGYGFEFDTYRNTELNDPSEEHMALIQGAASNHVHSELFSKDELEDESWHRVEITNSNGLVRMVFDSTSRFEYDIPGFTDYVGYFGFTAATATSFNSHKIDNVAITVPSRTTTVFGRIASCVPFKVDTVLRVFNNNHDGRDLKIDSIEVLPLIGDDIFVVNHRSLPLVLSADEFLDITVQFNTDTPGVWKTVLAIYGNGSEFVTDTLSISLSTPSLRWNKATLEFPPAHVNSFSEQSISLTNTGTMPAEVHGILSTWQEFMVMEPSTFPVVIPPGESINVVIRFAPSIAGGQNALLQLKDFCGTIDDVLLLGEGYEAYVTFAFADNLMLHPSETGTMTVTMQNNESQIPTNEFSFNISYNPDVVQLTKVLHTNSIVPSSAVFEWSEDTPGTVLVYIWTEQPVTASGRVFGLEFKDIVRDFACGDIVIDTVVLNPASESPGVPFTLGDSSTTCINASCRVPGGIHKILPPEISVAPNPAGKQASAQVQVEKDQECDIFVVNQTGSTVQEIHHGILSAGTHSFPMILDDLAAGLYFLVYDSNHYRKTVPVLHLH